MFHTGNWESKALIEKPKFTLTMEVSNGRKESRGVE
jgi:hypothetical protein